MLQEVCTLRIEDICKEHDKRSYTLASMILKTASEEDGLEPRKVKAISMVASPQATSFQDGHLFVCHGFSNVTHFIAYLDYFHFLWLEPSNMEEVQMLQRGAL